MDETGQPYAYTGDDPVNGVDPLGLCSTNGGTFLVPGACDFTSKSWVSQTENALQDQKGGGFSITNGLKAVADYGAAIGNVVTSTATLGHVKISAPYCGFGWASDTGTIFGTLALGVLGGGAGAAGEVAEGAETVEEVEAGAQAGEAAASVPKGGVYSLRDTETGDIVRTGRSSSLAVRAAAHANDPVLGDYGFQVEYETDNYAEQRGLEQMLYDQNPGAQAVNGGFNYIRGISLTNPNLSTYMQAAQDFLAGAGGG